MTPIILRARSDAILVAALLGLGQASTACCAETTSNQLARVHLSSNGKHLVVGESPHRFVPWGFNYLGKFECLAEDDWDTTNGWRRVEEDFEEMRALGANVVRWHLQFHTFMMSADRPDESQLARLKRLLALARDTGLYLNLTGLNCFRLDRIPAWYDALPEAERWNVQARFWEAVAKTCAGDPAVFCYDLMNEPVINEPREGEHPWVGGELGGFYFVQRISNKLAGRDPNEIAASWVKQMVSAIRRRDPEALTTVGVIPWAFVWPSAKPIFYSPDAIRHLDLVSIHVYPQPGKLEQELTALSTYRLGKPLIIEETFPLSCSLAELDAFVNATTNLVDGWISHYFGHTVAEHEAGAKPAGPLTAAFLEYWSKKGKDVATPLTRRQ